MILAHDAIQINNHLMNYNGKLIADHASILPELPYYYAASGANYFVTAKNDVGLYNNWKPVSADNSTFSIISEFDNAVNIDNAFSGPLQTKLVSVEDSQSGRDSTCFANVTAANRAFYGISFSDNVLPQLFEKSSGFYSLKEANFMFYADGQKWDTERYEITIPDNSFNRLRQADYMFWDANTHDVHIRNNCFNAIGDLSANIFSPYCSIEIGDNCFNNVTAIERQVFGAISLSSIGGNCFNSISSITSPFTPTNTTALTIGDNSFRNLRVAEEAFVVPVGCWFNFDLNNLTLLENGNGAFAGDLHYTQTLETTHLPNLTAGNYMFKDCASLSGNVSSFIQTNSARIVEHKGMFYGCLSLDGYHELRMMTEYSAWFN